MTRMSRGSIASRFLSTLLMAAIILGAGVVTVVLTPAAPAVAADADDFDPGYIISDENFWNHDTMTVEEIQDFLDKYGPTNCNNCLREYVASTYDRSANPDRCPNALVGKDNISAAQMIYDVSQACEINPQVLLVILQKEMSLITMSSPGDWRYQRAMGYGCPDSAPCNTSYYGLFIQLYSAASQLNWYSNPRSSFHWYPINKVTAVRYHPNSACGVSAVHIKNRATAALYYYTPYQPNAAALSNLYGTGNSCSAYGNRNFWRMYTDWFGDPTASPSPLATGDVIKDPLGNVYVMDENSRIRIDDCDMAFSNYGYSCADAVAVPQDRLNSIPIDGDLSPLAVSSTGARYWVEGEVRHEVLDDESLEAAGLGDLVGSPMSALLLSVYPIEAPLTRSGVLITDRADAGSVLFTTAEDAGYRIEADLQNQTVITTWLGGNSGELDAESLGFLTTEPFPAMFTVDGALFGLGPGGRLPLASTNAWDGGDAPALDSAIADLIPVETTALIAPVFVTRASDGDIVLIDGGTQAEIPSDAALAAVAAHLSIPASAPVVADAVFAGLPVGDLPSVTLPSPSPSPSATAEPTPFPTPSVTTTPDPTPSTEPTPEPTTTTTTVYKTHKVVRGDTVWALSIRYGSTIPAIIAENNLNSRALIIVGQTLTIPLKDQPAAGTQPAAKPTVTGIVEHTVVRGDTVWDLARKYNSSVTRIVKANDLNSRALIFPGQKLKIPTG